MTLALALSIQPWAELGLVSPRNSNDSEHDVSASTNKELMVLRAVELLFTQLCRIRSSRLNRHRKRRYRFLPQGANHSQHSTISYDEKEEEIELNKIRRCLHEYVETIAGLYNDVNYHSFQHASHVLLAANKLMLLLDPATDIFDDGNGVYHDDMYDINNAANMNCTSPMVHFTMIFAAMVHDVGHTGVPNAVLVEEQDPVAIRYDNVSVAEQYSIDLALELLREDRFEPLRSALFGDDLNQKVGVLENSYRQFEENVRMVILVTDISSSERQREFKRRFDESFSEGQNFDAVGNVLKKRDSVITAVSGMTDACTEVLEDKNEEPPPEPLHRMIFSCPVFKGTGKKPYLPTIREQRFSATSSLECRASYKTRRSSSLVSRRLSGVPGRRRSSMTSNLRRGSALGRRISSIADVSRRASTKLSFSLRNVMAMEVHHSNELQRDSIMEQMILAADVAHCMQDWDVFVKWNKKLYNELMYAHLQGRSFNPATSWYKGQIGFFNGYIIPLAERLAQSNLFGESGNMFSALALENKRRWITEGESLTDVIIQEANEMFAELPSSSHSHNDDQIMSTTIFSRAREETDQQNDHVSLKRESFYSNNSEHSNLITVGD